LKPPLDIHDEREDARSRATNDLPLQGFRLEGVIFDMDGLLLDTETLAMKGLEIAAVEMGVEAPEPFLHAMIGVPADRCRVLVAERFGESFPTIRFLERASLHMEGLIEKGALKLKRGALELLGHLEMLAIPKAVATSSSRAKADRHLRRVGILDRFDAIVTRDEVERGKPHPDLYLRAAKEIGVAPANCLALEDSYNGIRSASAAGVAVIMVPDLLAPTDEMRAKCATIVADLLAVLPLIASGGARLREPAS